MKKYVYYFGGGKADGSAKIKALPASPGVATEQVVFNADDAVTWKDQGKKVILVRTETSSEDITGMNAAAIPDC